MSDEEYEKLYDLLQARIQRDQDEFLVWYETEKKRLDKEHQATKDRLYVKNDGTDEAFKQELEALEKQRTLREKENEERQKKLQKDLDKGELHHVWVDAKQEDKFNEAKIIWDSQVNYYYEHYRKAVPKEIFDLIRDKYGPAVLDQCVKSTLRDIEKREKQDKELERMKAERAEALKKEEAERQRLKEQQQQKDDFTLNGKSATFDPRYKKPVNDNAPEQDEAALKAERERLARLVQLRSKAEERRKRMEQMFQDADEVEKDKSKGIER